MLFLLICGISSDLNKLILMLNVLADHQQRPKPAQQYCDLAVKQLQQTFTEQDYNAFMYWTQPPPGDYYHNHSVLPPTDPRHALQR